jgi:signal transduction histidine kinase
MSLRWKLSWLLALTAIVTVTVFGFVAYRAAHAAALEAAHARLRSAVVQINTIAEVGGINLLELLRRVSSEPAVRAVVEGSTDQPADDLLEALQPLRGVSTAAASGTAIDLIGADGQVRFAFPPDAENIRGPSLLPFTAEGVVGPMFKHDDALYFETAVAVGAQGGGLRMRRRLTSSSASSRIAANLLGPEADLLIGNTDGILWNGNDVVAYPGQPEGRTRYTRSGTVWLSSADQVKQTPWMYAVELPEAAAIAPARALLMPFFAAGVIIALLGVVAGLRLGQQVTAPLLDLTAATESIARGDRDVPQLATDRTDEVGRLARAFDSMTASVRAVQTRLESDVDSRTAELTSAISRLRQLDGQLQQSERLATLGRLSSSVGHELRNPLGVMNTVVVLIDAMPDASPKLKEYARLLREQIRLSERIIADLLDRARSGAPVPTVVDVDALLDDIVERVEVPENIRVERQHSEPLPPVSLDRDHVGQILWNLLNNAVQAIEDHGPATGTVTVSAAATDGRLRIEVRDTGPGVNPATAEQVFDPMYTTKADGVGLGLSISRAFAKAGGGDLFIAPSNTGGACFVLELPLAHG